MQRRFLTLFNVASNFVGVPLALAFTLLGGIEIRLPSGGGFGDPLARDPAHLPEWAAGLESHGLGQSRRDR